MKRLKFLPSVLMLVLSIAVLGLGVYAASPSTNTVTGSIKINASSYPIALRCLLDDNEIEYHQTIRSGITWTDGLSNLEFNTDTALTLEDVADRVITLEVTNLSNVNLGAYFLTDDETLTAENKATLNSISTTEYLTSGSNTVVKVSKTGYTKMEPNETVSMTVTMELYKFFFEEMNVGFSYVLNIEECQDALLPLSQGINVNTNGLDVTLTQSVNHGETVETGMVTELGAGRYSTTNLAVDDDNWPSNPYGVVKKFRTTEVVFNIENNSSTAIVADVNASLNNSNIVVTTLGNGFIDVGESGKVSVQFTVKPMDISDMEDYGYDGYLDYIEGNFAINTVNCKIDICKATAEKAAENDIYGRMKYSAYGYYGSGLEHYIEYGDNPFVENEKLKWYVWGVKVGTSNLRAVDTDDEVTVDGVTKLKQSTESEKRVYYFISEHILDSSDSNPYINYINEYITDMTNYFRADGNSLATYSGSMLQQYLSGVSVAGDMGVLEQGSTEEIYIRSGNIINFYDFYNLSNDPIFNKISSYGDVADKFWIANWDEMNRCYSWTSMEWQAKYLSDTDGDWGEYWNRGATGDWVDVVDNSGDSGSQSLLHAADGYNPGTRPVFCMEI